MLRLLVIGFALSLGGCSADRTPAAPTAPAAPAKAAGKAGGKVAMPPME